MEKLSISEKLTHYQPENPREAADLQKISQLIGTQALRSFDRDNYVPGHITGSAWILSPDRRKALMTHHLKLQKWLQLGGHSDSDPYTQRVALREGREESGLTSIKPLHDRIFDLDVHLIPRHRDIPEHYHFDLRFLFEADDQEPFLRQEKESLEIRWILLSEMSRFTTEESINRLVRKTLKLFSSPEDRKNVLE